MILFKFSHFAGACCNNSLEQVLIFGIPKLPSPLQFWAMVCIRLIVITNSQILRWFSASYHNRTPNAYHGGVIKWKHFPGYWPFVRGIHHSPVNSPHKGQWQRALEFSLIFAWMIGWVNNRDDGYLTRHRVHYDATVMMASKSSMYRWYGTVINELQSRIKSSRGGKDKFDIQFRLQRRDTSSMPQMNIFYSHLLGAYIL